ncbi:MAG: DNA primase [Parvibaculales bacterium]
MAFPQSFLEDIKSRIRVSDIVGRKVRLQKKGREFVGLSPFNKEKTPSFTVNDEKQFYHCFSSGKHGSVFDFLMETEGLSFIEAVQRLAQEVGLEMPKFSPEEKEREEKQKSLIDVTEIAAKWFREQLYLPQGKEALDYLLRRGVDKNIIEKFAIGYAPQGRKELFGFLKKQGIEEAQMIEVGLCIKPEDGGELYDRFRHRVMFPIQDARGRTIAFGGRALSANAPAKYLNSPQTPLFHKGKLLFNEAAARAVAYQKGMVIVVEGYMDVVACARAGFDNAVAPLGTALTERQIERLWRMAEEPILCFDADMAGLQAAWRAMDRALPLLSAGKSLRFALLPDGKDPDDMVNDAGSSGLEEVFDRARPMVDMLWERAVETGRWNTPERRAAFEKQLDDTIKQIGNMDIRKFYWKEINTRIKKFFSSQEGYAPQRGASQKYYKKLQSDLPASRELKSSPLANANSFLTPRQAFIIVVALRYPLLLEREENRDEFEFVELHHRDLERLRHDALDIINHSQEIPSVEALREELEGRGHKALLVQLDKLAFTHGLHSALRQMTIEETEERWKDNLHLYYTLASLKLERAQAEEEFKKEETEENFERLKLINNEITRCKQKSAQSL